LTIDPVEALAMRLPHVRFTVRRMTVAVALTGVILGWGSDCAKRGYPIVVFEHVEWVDNDPLRHPTKAVALDWDTIALEDGRLLHCESGPLLEGMGVDLSAQPGVKECLVDVEDNPNGSVAVYVSLERWFCGTMPGRGILPLRVPVFRHIENLSYRALLGNFRITRTGRKPEV
jgi:hypothetical protein